MRSRISAAEAQSAKERASRNTRLIEKFGSPTARWRFPVTLKLRGNIAEESRPQSKSRVSLETKGKKEERRATTCDTRLPTARSAFARSIALNLPEAGLLTRRSSLNRLAFPFRRTVAHCAGRSLLTVAGPCGNFTRFPFHSPQWRAPQGVFKLAQVRDRVNRIGHQTIPRQPEPCGGSLRPSMTRLRCDHAVDFGDIAAGKFHNRRVPVARSIRRRQNFHPGRTSFFQSRIHIPHFIAGDLLTKRIR